MKGSSRRRAKSPCSSRRRHAAETDFAAVDAALTAALAFMPLKPAAEMIADLTGASRKAVYARGLEKKNG